LHCWRGLALRRALLVLALEARAAVAVGAALRLDGALVVLADEAGLAVLVLAALLAHAVHADFVLLLAVLVLVALRVLGRTTHQRQREDGHGRDEQATDHLIPPSALGSQGRIWRTAAALRVAEEWRRVYRRGLSLSISTFARTRW
jgi:hypothetical protein